MKHRLFKKIIILIALLLAGWGILYFNKMRPRAFSETRIMMDTMVTIRANVGEAKSESVLKAGFSAFEQVEKFASFHLAESELSTFNNNRSLASASLLAEMIEIAGRYHRLTNSYFDPTFARLQKAYGFYDKKGRLPSDVELKELLAFTGWQDQVDFNAESGEYQLASGALIDLGGIAGGYAIVRAANAMKNAGCNSFLIDDGGDIWVEGDKPDGSSWKIAVRDPRDNSSLAVVEANEPLAISTSGNYERFVRVNGKDFGHIMNPLTGLPADFYKSVTVIASNPIAADVFSTAFYAMPPEDGFAWASENSLAILCLTSDDQVKMTEAGKKWFRLLK